MKVLCSCAQSIIHSQEKLVEVERSGILALSHASSTENMSFGFYFLLRVILFLLYQILAIWLFGKYNQGLVLETRWVLSTVAEWISRMTGSKLFPHSFFQSTIVRLVSCKVSEAHGNVTDVVQCETGTCIVSVTLYNEQIWGLYPVLYFYQLTNPVY